VKVERISGRRSQMMMAFSEAQEESSRVLPPSLIVNDAPMVRRLKDLEPVLYDASVCRDLGPELPLYTIYRTLWTNDKERGVLERHGLRYDVTDMPSLVLGEEHVKTFGHEHLDSGAWSHPELFEILEGEARFLLQRYHGEEVVDVLVVVAREGDVVLVPPRCGHVMINASPNRLIVGNLISRYCVQTYRRFIERRGGAYYLLKGGRLVRNENYLSLPEARTISAENSDFAEKGLGLLASFARRPELFRFLNGLYDSPQYSRSK